MRYWSRLRTDAFRFALKSINHLTFFQCWGLEFRCSPVLEISEPANIAILRRFLRLISYWIVFLKLLHKIRSKISPKRTSTDVGQKNVKRFFKNLKWFWDQLFWTHNLTAMRTCLCRINPTNSGRGDGWICRSRIVTDDENKAEARE